MQPMQVFILDPELLKLAKQLAQEPQVASAIAALKQQADRALKQPPLTVVDDLTPPSGDPHDYMSLSIYWWPNPDTPDGLPYVERDGEVNPEVNQYDEPKLNLMASTVETLALAYYFTDYEPYAEHAARLLRTWFIDEKTRMNPNLNHGQFVPGKNTGSRQGIIETAILATKVIDSVGLLALSPSWTKTDQAQLQTWFESYREWLRTSWLGIQEAFRTNNHGMWYDVQLASFDRFVGDDAAAKRRLTSITPLRISNQVESDGSQPQELRRARGFDYSLYNLDAMFTLASIGEKLGIDLWNLAPDGGGIEKALNFLISSVESGQLTDVQSNINPAGLLPFLRRAAYAYQDSEYEQLLDEISQSANVNTLRRTNLLHPDPELVESIGSALPDFNRDGQADLLWRNAATGRNAVWFMDGTTRLSSTAFDLVPNASWDISGIGDFNGDNHDDLVWRNAATGQNAVWFMDGTTRLSNAFFSSVPNAQWELVV